MNLIDTSALYNFLVKGETGFLANSFILDLTLYEFANVIWKHYAKIKTLSKDESYDIIENFNSVPFKIIRIESDHLFQIFSIASEYRITVYDSAYIYYAKRHSLNLITSDDTLSKVWKGIKK